MENKKVKVTNLVTGRVFIDMPERNFKRVWEKKGAVKTIPFSDLEEIIYEEGVENMFKTGILGIDDFEVKVALGLEEEGAEPTIITLTDVERKRYMTTLPFVEFKTQIQKLSREQIQELAQYAIDNEIMDLDKSDLIKTIVNVDIIESIKLNRANTEKI